MKLRKVIAGLAAATIATSAMAVIASAHEAFLMFTDANWGWGCWSAAEFLAGTTDVTTDGTYTVYIDSTLPTAQVEDEETGEMVGAAATGAQVFCVDIDGLAAAYNAGKDAVGYDDCTTSADKMAFAKAAGIEVSDVTVTTTSADGTTTDVAVDQSKIFFGDIEGNGKLRIEIFNAFGETVNDAPIDTTAIAFDESIAVTFTIAGLGGDAADTVVDTDAPVAGGDKTSPDTGVEGVAAVAGLAVVAAGAVVLSKKRK